MDSSERNRLMQALSARLSPRLLGHVRRVEETAIVLAQRFGVDAERAALAGLLHDYARELPATELLALARARGVSVDAITARHPGLLHGPVAAALLPDDLGISDPAVLQAIALHTTGAAHMTALDKVVWLADYIEPARDFPRVHPVRELAERDLDAALTMAMDNTICYLLEQGAVMHPAIVAARNAILAAGAGRWPDG